MHPQPISEARSDLRWTRWYYFFLGGQGFIAPYLNLFYTRLLLTGAEIGIIKAAGSVILLFLSPFWANQSERAANPKRLLQMALFFTAMGYLLLSQQTAFWGILVVSVLMSLVGAGMLPLTEGLAVSITNATKTGFGSIRILTSIGWVGFVLLGGWLAQNVSITVDFIGIAVCFLCATAAVSKIRADRFRGAHRAASASVLMVLNGLRQNPSMVALALMMVITGLLNNGVLQFENVYLDHLGAPEGLIGVAGILSAVIEVPCMLWADRLLRRSNPRRLLLMALLMNASVRLLVLISPSIESIMLERAAGGVAFSFYTVALIQFMTRNTPNSQTRTVLALYNVALPNLINMVGAPLTGSIYDTVGMPPLFAMAVVGYLVGWVVLLVGAKPKAQV
ncbi:hypothetical protein ARNL5_02835 [Anaerolineae bacterium]|nr:MFS transporter [Anaerolinea sp.]MCC6975098.1 MFS transporter [Anaerolineae bacterium]CAG0985839.1 hypothetical protein ARNL5_02835 [Anaerolineae bacterium]